MPDAHSHRDRRRRQVRHSARAPALVVAGPFVAVARALVRVGRDPDSRNILVASAILLLSGTVLFRIIEDLAWLDALYFSFVTLTTIGYGDITPETGIGKVVMIIYSIAGLGILTALISAIATHSGRSSSRDSG